MNLYVSETLEDGATVVSDSENPNTTVILKKGQWEEIAGLPESEQRHRLREFLAHNAAGPDPRTETEHAQVEASEQGQGERHQED